MQGSKFLDDLVTRLGKLSDEELDYVLTLVSSNKVAVQEVDTDNNFDGGRTPDAMDML